MARNSCRGHQPMALHPSKHPSTRPSTQSSRPTDVPLARWPVAQTAAQCQRAGRSLAASSAHPGKMLPALAARILTEYSGLGTTLVEAARLHPRTIGVELEPRWAELARAQGAPGTAKSFPATPATALGSWTPAGPSPVALVLTAPLYGPSVHRQVSARPGAGFTKSCDRYYADPANSAHVGQDRLLTAMGKVLTAAARVLRSRGGRDEGSAVVAARGTQRPPVRSGQARRTDRAGAVWRHRRPALRVARGPAGAPRGRGA
ncbi:MAG: TRM11 family methyltransferase [Mycobacteriales bacterium]